MPVVDRPSNLVDASTGLGVTCLCQSRLEKFLHALPLLFVGLLTNAFAYRLLAQLVVKHNNNTGRWVTPFRPCWSPSGDGFLVGDMKRGVALFDAATGKQLGLKTAEGLMTAIPSRFAVHPAGAVDGSKALFAAATSSGRVHVWRC